MEGESRVARRLRCLRSGVNANFTILCKDREWKVDKGILVAESEYFEKLCIGDFTVCSPSAQHGDFVLTTHPGSLGGESRVP